jgi:lycopene cyclase domain-containing protein
MAKYTYLLIDLLTILFPLLLSFDKNVAFRKSWKYLWQGILITGLVFLFWDVIFTLDHVWSFNPKYIIGINILGLPLEEMLFFVTVPFACTFIYACLNHYLKWEINNRLTRVISNVIVVFSILILVFYHHRLYTRVNFTLVAFLVILFQFILKVRWLNHFYLAYLVALLPFYIVNGLLTALPIVLYNNDQNMGLRLGTIPVEDHFYLMALLLMNIGLFEYFKSKAKSLYHA